MTLTTLDMMKWVEDLSVKNGALEQENKNQKLKILELEKKLMSGNVCVRCQQANPRRETMKVESESDLIMSKQIPMTIQPLQIEVARENSEISGAVMSMSSEGVDFPIDDIHVKKEAVDDLISDNLQNETPSMDDEIDIKEEDVDYGYAKSKSGGNNSIHDPSLIDSPNADRLSETPIKHESERSIQRMFRSPEKVANIELASADFEAEVGTNHDLNHTSPSYLTKNLVCSTLDKPQPQLSIQSLYGHKENEPYLKTRTAEKIDCETCQMSFDTQFKLMEHIKCHTGEYPLTCCVCMERSATARVLVIHMKTHPEVKLPTTTLKVDHKGVSAKRNLTVEKEKVNLVGRSKKQRKVGSDGEVRNEEMPIVGKGNDPPCVDETNPLKTQNPENPNVPDTGHCLQTVEKSGMNGSLMAMSSVGDGSPFGEILVTEEPMDEFVPDNPLTETPAMDEDVEIDAKEVDVDYGHDKSKSVGDDSIHDIHLIDSDLNFDNSLDIPITHDIDKSIQRMFLSPEKVSNTEPDPDDFYTEIGTNHDLNHGSASYLTEELLCPKLVKPEAQVSTLSLCGQKEKVSDMMTRPTEKIHRGICYASFVTEFELREHKKSHTREKTICTNPKNTFKCYVCEKRFSTKIVLSIHMKTHTGGNLSTTTLQVDHKGFSAKRNLTVENKKEVNLALARRSKKQWKGDSENKVCNDEEMPIVGVGEGKDPPCGTIEIPHKRLPDHVDVASHCISFRGDSPTGAGGEDKTAPTSSSSSSIQINCEGDKNIDEVGCSQEEDLKFEFESEIESGRDADYTPSPHLTPNAPCRRLTKNKSCGNSKCCKSKNHTPSSQRQFKCDKCDSLFCKKIDLTAHKRIHRRERPHKCEVCEKSFLQSSHLTTHKRIHTGEKPYKCEECEMSFSDKSALNSHKRIHSGEKPFKCDVCEKDFRDLTSLTLHKRSHTGERPYECTVCKKRFARFGGLNTHKMIHTGEMPFQCQQCEKRFIRSDQLTIHRRNHTGERPHKCDVCEKSFTTLANMTRHKRTHTGEKPNKCDECDMSFSEKSALSLHKRIHTGENPFKCDVSAQNFTNLTSLTLHKRSHTGERPYECTVCKKRFVSLGGLNRHKRIHTGEKPFQCEQCEKSFARMSDLSIHKRIHTGEKPYKCDMCENKFTSLTSLTEHKRTHTGERPYECTVCNKRFTRISVLYRHRRIHTGEMPFQCEQCEKSFSWKSCLSIHKRIHTGEKPYKCDVCEKRFARSAAFTLHKTIHTGEKPFICDVCEKSFLWKSGLSIHKRMHTGEKRYGCTLCEKRFTRSANLTSHKKIHAGETSQM